jgi:hypothetical protein
MMAAAVRRPPAEKKKTRNPFPEIRIRVIYVRRPRTKPFAEDSARKRGEQNFLFGIARNPLKSPDSDE